MRSGDMYFVAYPELLIHAVTRGLYFFFAELKGESFKKEFGDAFEAYALRLARAYFGSTLVLSENDERQEGYSGKNNDFTVLLGETAFLFECKASGLFATSKKQATLEAIRHDLKKNLVNAKEKSGLFQLHAKCEAIRNGTLPDALQRKYNGIKNLIPII